ncbi:MAG: hypothetical protein AAGJ10_08860 [Bacteroidota bacterium]
MAIGVLLIVASMLLSAAGPPIAFNIVAVAWGCILVALAQYFRHRSAQRVMAAHMELRRTAHERARWQHQQAQLEQLLAHGLPPAVALEEARTLLAAPRQDDTEAAALAALQQTGDRKE